MHAVRHTDDASTWTPVPDWASGDSGFGGAAAERGEFGDEEEDFVAEVRPANDAMHHCNKVIMIVPRILPLHSLAPP